ncbi:MAG: Asp-tRNA(Asn)/Glu-tRNA(Gln) amidotransferase subunit GatA [Methylophilaceae bacterium]
MKDLSLNELHQGLKNKDFSSVELTQYYLNQIKDLNTDINAFITVDEEKSIHQAHQADQLISQNHISELTGIPIAQKDIFCASSWKTTCGSKMLDNFYAPYDSKVVDLFNKSGAINLGKTNMDEFAMGSSNETSYYGAVKNPWNLDFVPGGSSGGSAAAVASRMSPAATATDTGGSIRQPASLCNLTGLKPTYGLVSRFGMIAFASSLDQAGPIAKTAEDCALMLNVMADFDERDSTSIKRDKENYTQSLNASIQGKIIGIPKEFFNDELNDDVKIILEKVMQAYQSLGVNFKEISLPNSQLSIPVYYVIAPAEASSNLSRYDGVKFGYRASNYKDLEEMYLKTREEGFGDEVKRRILVGTYVLSAGYYDAYYLKAQKIRRLIADDFTKAFTECDLILAPSSPSTAFKIGDKTEDPVAMYMQDMYTISTNLAGLPAISAPAGFINKMPIGFQLIGNYFEEAKILNFTHQYQSISDWHKYSPGEVL